MDIFKFCGALILVLCLVLVLRTFRAPYAVLVSAGAALLFLLWAFEGLSSFLNWFSRLSEQGGWQETFDVLLRALGIGICTGFLSEFCRDLGEGTLSRVAELVGKVAILSVALPLFYEFLELIATTLSFAS